MLKIATVSNVTRFVQNFATWATFEMLGQFLRVYLVLCKKVHCSKWPIVIFDKMIKPSGHTDCKRSRLRLCYGKFNSTVVITSKFLIFTTLDS